MANVVVALFAAVRLAQFVATLPYAMPPWLESAIRAGIRATGSTQLDNPNDIETIAAMILLSACWAVVGAKRNLSESRLSTNEEPSNRILK